MDRFMMWSIVASVCIVLIALAVPATFLWWLASTFCSAWDIESVPSPNGSLEAVIHQSDCGATTPFTTRASVVKRIFGIETSRETLFIVHDLYDLPVRWIDDATLAIGVPAEERVYRKDTTFDGGRVVYEDGGVVPPSTRAGP